MRRLTYAARLGAALPALALCAALAIAAAACFDRRDATPSPAPTLANVLAQKTTPTPSPSPTPIPSPTPTLADCLPTPGIKVPTPTPAVTLVPLPPYHDVSAGLEEQIFRSDVIVRASLASARAATETLPSDDECVAPTYRPAQELRFVIHEYLKGSGPDNILVVVHGRHTYITEADARRVADSALARRNATWDRAQGILFLREPFTQSDANDQDEETLKTYAFTLSNYRQSEWDYTVDTLSRAWLPAAEDSLGASAQSQAPAPEDALIITGGAATIDDETFTPDPITLTDLRSTIAEMAATLKAGEGVAGFDRCIETRIWYERHNRASPQIPLEGDETIASGSEVGTEIDGRDEDTLDTEYSRYLVNGPDSGLFQTMVVDDDRVPANGYRISLNTARPLPAGEYHVHQYFQSYRWMPCDFKRKYPFIVWIVRVTAPALTLHEAFFDPVAMDLAVGADATNGVLKPTSFAVDSAGTTTTLDRIAWESRRATIEVSPAALPANHHVDFIGLEGKFALRLDIDDATKSVDGDDTTLTWGVCKQPWKAGDKLMLRISKSPANLTGATNDVACDGAAIPTLNSN